VLGANCRPHRVITFWFFVAPERPPKGLDWLHEPKWDGFRFQVIKEGSHVRLYSKGGAAYKEGCTPARGPRLSSQNGHRHRGPTVYWLASSEPFLSPSLLAAVAASRSYASLMRSKTSLFAGVTAVWA
jgi:hypothetical protein